MKKDLLEARELTFGYSAERPIIQHASFSLPRGTVAAVIGANGCGKSTLMRLLAGVLHPVAGSVELEGLPLSLMDRRRVARKIGYVPQTSSNVFPFTALEVVLTGRSPYLPGFGFENSSDVLRARDAMAAAGIQHLADRPIQQLSGGERQLVSLARALAQEPACLLLDEPSASLDLKHRTAIMHVLATLRNRTGASTLIATHDLSLIDSSVDLVFALYQGSIAASGRPDQVLCAKVLREIYQDFDIRVRQLDGRTFVWSQQ